MADQVKVAQTGASPQPSAPQGKGNKNNFKKGGKGKKDPKQGAKQGAKRKDNDSKPRRKDKV